MFRKHIAYFLLISSIFVTVLAQGNVGDVCRMRITGVQGICKLVSDCPQVQELAANGVTPTLCNIPFLSNTYIVCCEGAQNTVSNTAQPNENSFLNTDGGFVFPVDSDNPPPRRPIQPSSRSKSEEKCVEYTKSVTGIVSAAPLTIDPDQIVSVPIEKCENAGISLIVGGEPASAGEFPFMASKSYLLPASYNDIALLRLASQVVFTQFIRPACLWSRKQLDTTKTIATGWGRIGVADDLSDKLLKVELNVFDNSLCSKRYSSSRKLPQGIVSTMLCAGKLEGGKDTCQGDSGGPLLAQNEKNRCIFHIVGITSFGKGCGGPNLPAIYTRISEYVPWIENIIW
ncbi:hypothetical protein ILUMI_21287 [Ignelater luminosus]|uniref:Peptidase S1 domain-containing protein n=1 Tax=Ignelater luminosus TaxID=2038154 RepID=A0A8K0CI05_IGNLU|nr:hypothetical protein ILUMI_21287 [Ignelater luminosus]